MSLEPNEPETALDLYLADRENNVSRATIYSHKSRLGHFILWCDKQQIGNLYNLMGRQLQQYRIWRRSEGDLSPVTVKTQMDTLRVFIKWLESVDGVEQDLHAKVRSLALAGKENVRNVMLDEKRAERVLGYLRKYEYASRQHVSLALMWHAMMRVGAVHSLDCADYLPED